MMTRSSRLLTVGLFVATLFAAFLQAPVVAQVLPGDGPKIGPFEIFTEARIIDSPFGTLVETTLIVDNASAVEAGAFLVGSIDWPDGTSQMLRYGPPVVIPVRGAVIIFALSIVPPRVGSGEATFTGVAILTNVGSGPRADERGPLIIQDSATFDIP